MRARVLTEEPIDAAGFAASPGRASKPEESGGWEPVRDSWVEVPPALQPGRSEPPPLPSSVREPPSERSPANQALSDRMLERLAAGDYEAALMASEALLRRLPRDADAIDCAEMSRTELRRVYAARLGGALDRAPRIANREAIATVTLCGVTAYLLSRIDGRATLDEIAFGPDASPEEMLRVLSELYLRGILALDP